MSDNLISQYADSHLGVDIEPLEFDDSDHMLHISPVVSPLTKRYRMRLTKPSIRKRCKTRNSINLQSSTTSDTEEPFIDNYNDSVTISSTKSDTTMYNNNSKYIFNGFDSNQYAHSDRFIPSRFEFGTNCRNSFNMTDKFDNSPLSLMRNKKNNMNNDSDGESLNKPNANGYISDSSSNSNQKYDECLQNVLLSNKPLSTSTRIIPNNEDIPNNTGMNDYSHHLEECKHFNSKIHDNDSKNCICKYIVNERLNYNDSPRKVFKFNVCKSQEENEMNDD
eukprot:71976_1